MSEVLPGDRRVSGPRLIALVGPFQSGKTTLLEAILTRGGALSRQGRCATAPASAIPAPRRAPTP